LFPVSRRGDDERLARASRQQIDNRMNFNVVWFQPIAPCGEHSHLQSLADSPYAPADLAIAHNQGGFVVETDRT
jgi:hypothetical protein